MEGPFQSSSFLFSGPRRKENDKFFTSFPMPSGPNFDAMVRVKKSPFTGAEAPRQAKELPRPNSVNRTNFVLGHPSTACLLPDHGSTQITAYRRFFLGPADPETGCGIEIQDGVQPTPQFLEFQHEEQHQVDRFLPGRRSILGAAAGNPVSDENLMEDRSPRLFRLLSMRASEPGCGLYRPRRGCGIQE